MEGRFEKYVMVGGEDGFNVVQSNLKLEGTLAS